MSAADLKRAVARAPTPCATCGKTERESFTPAAFDMMASCLKCDAPVCTDCGDHDIDGSICQECP